MKEKRLIVSCDTEEMKEFSARNAGRKQADDKWVAAFAKFTELYESHKLKDEIIKEMSISRATYFRYKKLYNDTKIMGE